MKTLAANAFAILLTVLATVSSAATLPFERAQFDRAVAAGEPVAVVFHADWCPVCRAQAPALQQVLSSPDLKKVTLFIANFDTEKALKESLKVTKQSTVVVFKGGKESARSTGDTQAASLDALLHHAIS